eukprot:CAMPEP_0117447850 /NCGR_PEP_ID=MMETSP0759-20121206/7090_1 /TAXON_ID=63605 /ORGANISM="Percolomonas cosmopolitus, Strain WS" /LENGTH=612 /DNA_ID=CAMNT_0005240203 /DNA_START=421 /DNA_END=2259 /DNA_ORIENTATION=-
MAPSRRFLRPATVAFSLEETVDNLNKEDLMKVKRDDSKYVKKVNGEHLAVYYRFGDPALEYKVIRDTFIRAGLVKAPETGNDFEFNVQWSRHLKNHEYYKLNKYQKVNHFPCSQILSRKDSMHRALKRQKQRCGKIEYGFFPESYFLPQDQETIYAKLKKGKIFLMKPPGSSCGRGIEIIHSVEDLPELDEDGKCKYLIQEYLPNPFLIDRKKWDLRIYVLVTSYNPVRVYVFDNGLVRFCTEDFDINSNSRFAHLTNFSVNKQSGMFVYNTNHEEDDVGSKWSIRGLKRYFKRYGIDDSDLWRQVDDVIVKTIIAVEPNVCDHMKRFMPGRRSQSCFELYGFDVMVCHTGNHSAVAARLADAQKVSPPSTAPASFKGSACVSDSESSISFQDMPASAPATSRQEKINLKAYVIEVNVAPSLAIGSALDKHIKQHLLTDTLHIIGIIPYNRKRVGDQIEMMKKKREKKRSKLEKEQREVQQQILNGTAVPTKDEEEEKEKPPHTLKDLQNAKFKLKQLTTKDYNLICELQDEEDKMGDFNRVFPTADQSYAHLFQKYSYNNALLFKWLNTPEERQEMLLKKYENARKRAKKSKPKTKSKSKPKAKKSKKGPA